MTMSLHRFLWIAPWLALSTICMPSLALADAPSFEIISTLQNTRIVTAVSSEGIITTHYANPSEPQQPSRRYLLRNSDHTLWVVDDEHRTYFTTSLAAQLETTLAALRRIRTITLPDEVGK